MVQPLPGRLTLIALAVAGIAGACTQPPGVQGQVLPQRVVAASPRAFEVAPDVAVLHYYGAGGWGVLWRGQYLLAAPYFSNHSLFELPLKALRPSLEAIREGFAGTPVLGTQVIVVGHGHIDHAGDIPGYFEAGLIAGRPTLVADRSTVNLLHPFRTSFGCVAALGYDAAGKPVTACPTPAMRVVPIHSDHAPHVKLLGANLALYGGIVHRPRQTRPTRGSDFRLGHTWGFLIDLLDEKEEVAFRIHYMDAASSPPHGLVLDQALRRQRDVDVHIACVPGFDLVDEYPDGVLRHHRVRYVLAGHWENFFRSRKRSLQPVPVVLSAKKLNHFVERTEQVLGRAARGVTPLNKSAEACGPDRCGPRGPTWALPVPGETFHFRAGPQPSAPALAAPD